ncbi:MAG TPA: hypothetical protein VHB73_02805, partial [Alphaproteobacteria bacterium]|nr:hypothetical protein [Alphaproteobacteria bacterium]
EANTLRRDVLAWLALRSVSKDGENTLPESQRDFVHQLHEQDHAALPVPQAAEAPLPHGFVIYNNLYQAHTNVFKHLTALHGISPSVGVSVNQLRNFQLYFNLGMAMYDAAPLPGLSHSQMAWTMFRAAHEAFTAKGMKRPGPFLFNAHTLMGFSGLHHAEMTGGIAGDDFIVPFHFNATNRLAQFLAVGDDGRAMSGERRRFLSGGGANDMKTMRQRSARRVEDMLRIPVPLANPTQLALQVGEFLCWRRHAPKGGIDVPACRFFYEASSLNTLCSPEDLARQYAALAVTRDKSTLCDQALIIYCVKYVEALKTLVGRQRLQTLVSEKALKEIDGILERVQGPRSVRDRVKTPGHHRRPQAVRAKLGQLEERRQP